MRITTIIILALILAIIISLIVVFVYIKKKLSKYSRALYGTSDILEGIDRAKNEMAQTPKSVSAMTSIFLPKIMKDFPQFNYDEMKERANNVLMGYLMAVNSKDTSYLKYDGTDLRRKLEQHITMLSSKNMHEHYENIKLHRTEISNYKKSKGRCIITFQTSAEALHYVTEEGGRVIEGDKEYKLQTKFDTDLIYIQDRDLVDDTESASFGLTCPNCGGPVTSLGAKVCEYCGSGIVEINIHSWEFCDVRRWR